MVSRTGFTGLSEPVIADRGSMRRVQSALVGGSMFYWRQVVICYRYEIWQRSLSHRNKLRQAYFCRCGIAYP